MVSWQGFPSTVIIEDTPSPKPIHVCNEKLVLTLVAPVVQYCHAVCSLRRGVFLPGQSTDSCGHANAELGASSSVKASSPTCFYDIEMMAAIAERTSQP